MEQRSTLYLDLDDDITAIIGKLRRASQPRVALVVPKRSTVLQSAVNLKLIKKAAKTHDKIPILITEDAVVSQLAARLDMLVGANIKATPLVPPIEKTGKDLPSDVIEGQAPDPKGHTKDSDKKSDPEPAKAAAAGAMATKLAKAKDKAIAKIPNFSRFKKRLSLGILGAVGLLLLLWSVLVWLPKATIAVSGQTETQKGEYGFTADTKAERPDYGNKVLPASSAQAAKTLTKTFTPTGKKDVGTKAKGEIMIKNCEDSERSFDLAAGTKFKASSGQVFLSDSAITVPKAVYQGGCKTEKVSVSVTASDSGEKYNLEATSYTTDALEGNFEISGSQMKGGTTKLATVVAKADVDGAKTELLNSERTAAKQELGDQFKRDDFIIEATFSETISDLVVEPKIDEEASGPARISFKVSYTQLGVKTEHLKELIRKLAREQAKAADKQLGVVDEGLDNAEFSVRDKPAESAQRLLLKGEVLLGPDINFDELKERVGGKKYSEAVEIVKSYPNVSGADVKFSPFWVRRVPKNPEKVTIEINVPEAP